MVNYCCVNGCGRKSKGSSLYFHVFPKDPARQELWCQAIGRPDIMEKSPEKRALYRVCSKHFDSSCIKNKHLSANAVPTLFLTGFEKSEDSVNNKVICDNCDSPVVGFRYKCITCENYDLCSRCEKLETHAHHFMLRIPTPAKFTEINNIFKKIQKCNDDSGCSSDDEPITKYKTEHLELNEDVKQKIRNEINRVFKTQSQKNRKRKATNDRKSEKIDPFLSSEVVFADVNALSVASVVEVKTENMYESLGEPSVSMDLKLTDDLNELMMEVN